MIWIATLLLLAVAAWLFFNALNERRWVEAHSHDEGVAADQGILPDFSRVSARLRDGSSGKVSIEQEDSTFARAVKKVQEKTARVGEKIESAAARGRERDDSETFFGRMVEKIGGGATRLDQKLDERARRQATAGSGGAAASGAERTGSGQASGGGNLFDRAVARVSAKQDDLDSRVRARVERKAAVDDTSRSASEEEGFFGTMVGRVSRRLDGMERRLDRQAEQARAAPGASGGLGGEGDDFLARTSAKVGARVNEVDERIVAASKKAAEKIDSKTDL